MVIHAWRVRYVASITFLRDDVPGMVCRRTSVIGVFYRGTGGELLRREK
jgi:hypothetical protein